MEEVNGEAIEEYRNMEMKSLDLVKRFHVNGFTIKRVITSVT